MERLRATGSEVLYEILVENTTRSEENYFEREASNAHSFQKQNIAKPTKQNNITNYYDCLIRRCTQENLDSRVWL
jgi:hypothetical protein